MATEKVEVLLHADAQITLVSPTVAPQILEWVEDGFVDWVQREFLDEDLGGVFVAIGATNNKEVNRRVYELSEAQGKLGNSADDPQYCNFIMSAITRRGPIQIAISSAGCSPALAQRIRSRIEKEILTESVGELACFLGSWRPAVREAISGFVSRKAFWEDVLDSEVPAILEGQGWPEGNLAMQTYLDNYAKSVPQ